MNPRVAAAATDWWLPRNTKRRPEPALPTLRPASSRPAPTYRRAPLFAMFFWFGLAAAVASGWPGGPADSTTTTTMAAVTTVASAMAAAGRLLGAVAGFALLAWLLLMSRPSWLERLVDACALLAWHRRLGALLLATVLGHAATTAVGTAILEPTWPTRTAWAAVVGAFVAAGLLTVAGILAIGVTRVLLPDHVWRWLRIASCLALLTAYGPDLVSGGVARWFWVGLHVVVLGYVGWDLLVGPLWLHLWHRFRVIDVVPETADTMSIYIGGRRLNRLAASGGQFFRLRFLARGSWWRSHPLSLSAAPSGRWLRVTVSKAGWPARDLRRLGPGVRVVASGPFGVCTADRGRRRSALLIAGGSGLAPARALLEEVPRGAVVLCRAAADDLALRDELGHLAQQRDARVCYLQVATCDPGPRRLLSPDGLRQLVPDVRDRDVYVFGPAALVTAATRTLRWLGVPKRQIHVDPLQP